MSITATCPHCGHQYTLDDALGGKRGRCKVCKEIFPIPQRHADPAEVTPGGVRVYRPEPKATVPDEPPAATPYIKQIERHIERHIGPAPLVFHELVSEDVHLDLHIVPPTNEPPSKEHPLGTSHYTVITSGLSARPMNVPPESRGRVSPYQELMIALPADWPGMNPDGSFDQEAMQDERAWWPLRWLKMVARMPHEYDTFLANGVTVPNGEEADPFADDTKLGCMMVFPSLLSPGVAELQINDQITIHFFAIWPIYPEEMNLKLQKGLEPLIDKFIEAEMTELINSARKNLCEKKR